jgi:hypothetical protein
MLIEASLHWKVKDVNVFQGRRRISVKDTLDCAIFVAIDTVA